MSDPVSIPSNRPIGEEPSGAGALLRHLIPLALLACVAMTFFFPQTLRRLLPGPFGDPAVAPLIYIGALFLMVAVGGIRDGRRRLASRRAALDAFASRVGGRPTQRPLRSSLGPGGEWVDGTQVGYTSQGLQPVLNLYRGQRATFACRLGADVALLRDFQLQLLPGGKAMRFVLSKSFLLPVLSVAARTGGSARVRVGGAGAPGSAGGASADMTPAVLAERLRYLAGDAITTGDPEFDRKFLVKSSDKDAGRTFAADPALHAALADLAARSRSFQVGVESDAPGAPGRLFVGANADVSLELFLAMDATLRAAAAALARAGVLDAGARGVA